MRLPAILLLCAIAFPAAGQAPIFGTNAGTFADYLPSYAMQAVPLRAWGTSSDIFNPHPEVVGANGSLIANFGSVTYAQNYPSGTYTLQFDSPAPVTITTAGFFGAPSNVTRTGTHTTMNVTLTHDNGNPLAGLGWFTAAGVSGSNPVSNFTLSQPGKNPADLTPTFSAIQNVYQGTRFMNSLEINSNVNLRTAANLVPSGYNAGQNSYADIVRWTNASPQQKVAMIEIPVNADASFIAQVAKTMSGLSAGKQVVVEYGNENWNYIFSQAGWLANRANSDPRVTVSDSFGKGAQEAGLMAVAMMQTFKANYNGPATVSGFLGSQGSNTYFADQEKQAIKNVYGAATLASLFQYQGISFYPGDGLAGAGDVTTLHNALEGDLPRLVGYLVADRNDAAASGLKELVYEWSPNGYLTRGGVPQAVIDTYRGDSRSKQLTLDTWAAINSNIGSGGIAFDFDVTGDGWSTQINPAGPHEQEQLAIDQISASLSVPEPSSVAFVLLGACAVLCRRRRGIGKTGAAYRMHCGLRKMRGALAA